MATSVMSFALVMALMMAMAMLMCLQTCDAALPRNAYVDVIPGKVLQSVWRWPLNSNAVSAPATHLASTAVSVVLTDTNDVLIAVPDFRNTTTVVGKRSSWASLSAWLTLSPGTGASTPAALVIGSIGYVIAPHECISGRDANARLLNTICMALS